MDLTRIGHTGITWPFTPEGATDAIADLSALGYRGFETFGFIFDDYPGGVPGLAAVLADHDVSLAAAYCSAALIDSSQARDDIEKMASWAEKVRALGGSVIVVGAASRQKSTYTADDYDALASTLNEIGRRCLEHGITAAFHPHTGTPVETREEIDRVMTAIDPEVVFFAPDTGQIAKGGGDPLDVIRTYRDLVRHVHLKDFNGRPVTYTDGGEEVDQTGYLNYVPLGEGAVDIPGILAALDDGGYDGWWMVELDGTPAAPYAPREAAAISKRYLARLAGEDSHDRSSSDNDAGSRTDSTLNH